MTYHYTVPSSLVPNAQHSESDASALHSERHQITLLNLMRLARSF